jgi:hypothetical protein
MQGFGAAVKLTVPLPVPVTVAAPVELPPLAGEPIVIQGELLAADQLHDVCTPNVLVPPDAGSVAEAG